MNRQIIEVKGAIFYLYISYFTSIIPTKKPLSCQASEGLRKCKALFQGFDDFHAIGGHVVQREHMVEITRMSI